MANPNPSPETRFGINGHTGRSKQKGARDRLSAAFLTALADAFDRHGAAVLEYLAQNDQATFARIIASLQPKELSIEERTPESDLSDEQLEQIYAELLREIDARQRAKTAPDVQ
jgi:hypothetical protein